MHIEPMPGHYANPEDDPGIVDPPGVNHAVPVIVGLALGICTYLVLLIVGSEMTHNVTRYEGDDSFWRTTWMWVAPLVSFGVAAVSIPLGMLFNWWLPNRRSRIKDA